MIPRRARPRRDRSPPDLPRRPHDRRRKRADGTVRGQRGAHTDGSSSTPTFTIFDFWTLRISAGDRMGFRADAHVLKEKPMSEILMRPIGVIHTPHRDQAGAPIQPAFAESVRGTVRFSTRTSKRSPISTASSGVWLLYEFDRSMGWRVGSFPTATSWNADSSRRGRPRDRTHRPVGGTASVGRRQHASR